MIPAPRHAARPAELPLPGDLYLDPAVPAVERVTLARNGWCAEVTHVWTGTGWARLLPGAVRPVPAQPVLPAPAAAVVASARSTGLASWRARKQLREDAAARRALEAGEVAAVAARETVAAHDAGDGWAPAASAG